MSVCSSVVETTKAAAGSDTAELRSLLYGLDAILRLHTAQEDETYLTLGDPADEPLLGRPI